MKTVGGLHAQILERGNLLEAVHLAAKGRKHQPAVAAYLAQLDHELERLRGELASGQLRCGECATFTIYDPKERQITAPIFRERVLHHAVMRICGPVLDRRLIHHSYACRVGKGTLRALHAAKDAASGAPWFLKLDVRKYFYSISHARLEEALARVFREAKVKQMLHTLVKVYAPEAATGLAIGTLVSQHLANFYLAPLDTAILQELRPHGYVRYMDDLALWFREKDAAIAARSFLTNRAAGTLALEFKTAFVNRSALGMDFLGHRVFPHRLGLNRSSRRRFQTRLQSLHAAWKTGAIREASAQQRATALTAATALAACQSWRRRVVMNLGDGPQTRTACCAAAAGSTTAGTPDPPSATATTRITATTTSVSGLVPAPAARRSVMVEPACLPVPPPRAVDETPSSLHRPVAPSAVNRRATVDGGSASFSS